MSETESQKINAQILVLTPDELKSIITRAADVAAQQTMILFESKIAEQKEYYERLLSVREIAAELQSSVDSVYRYWREGSLEYLNIRPNQKGSTRFQIERFRRNLGRRF